MLNTFAITFYQASGSLVVVKQSHPSGISGSLVKQSHPSRESVSLVKQSHPSPAPGSLVK